MPDPIRSYLDELRSRLVRRVPEGELSTILDESEGHLLDLAEERGGPEAAIAKFGTPARYAARLLRARDVVLPVWRAAREPLAVVLVLEVLDILMALTMTYTNNGRLVAGLHLALTGAGSVAFFFACFRARRMLWVPALVFCLAQTFLFAGISGILESARLRSAAVWQFHALDARDREIGTIRSALVTGRELFKKPEASIELQALPTPLSGFATPRTLLHRVEAVSITGRALDLSWNGSPLLFQPSSTRVEVPLGPATYAEAQRRWNEDFDLVSQKLATLDKDNQQDREDLSRWRDSWFAAAVGRFPLAAAVWTRLLLAMLELNALAYLLYRIRRAIPPRRLA